MRWPGHRLALAFAGGLIAIWLVTMAVTVRIAALPPNATGPMIVVFEPGTPEDRMFAGIIAAGAKPMRSTSLGFVWVVTGDDPGLAGRLASHGAIGTYGELPFSPTLAGCFAYVDAKAEELFSLRP